MGNVVALAPSQRLAFSKLEKCQARYRQARARAAVGLERACRQVRALGETYASPEIAAIRDEIDAILAEVRALDPRSPPSMTIASALLGRVEELHAGMATRLEQAVDAGARAP